MVLTIPWAASIIHGRVAVVNGVADYKNKRRAGKPLSLLAGVSPRRSVMLNGRIMIGTSLAYFIIQGAAFGVKCDEKDDKHCHGSSVRTSTSKEINSFISIFRSLVSCS